MSMIRIDIKKNWKGEIIKQKGRDVRNKSIYQIGYIVENQAKEFAARDQGYLAASINMQSKDMGTELESPSKYAKNLPKPGHDVSTFQKIAKPTEDNVVLVGTHIDYGPHQEFGTVKMDAAPFLRPAADLAQGKVVEQVKIAAKTHFLQYLIQHEQYLQSRGI